jgi:hypothetical protein
LNMLKHQPYLAMPLLRIHPHLPNRRQLSGRLLKWGATIPVLVAVVKSISSVMEP